MEWEDIVPQRGVRIKQSPGVTVALRVPDAGRPMMAVTIGREMRDTLGWQPKQRVRVQRNMAAGLVRLSLTDEPGAGYALHGSGANSCLGATFHFPGLPAERRRAEPAENRIEEGALIFAAPAWARGEQPARVTPPAEKPTPPPPKPAPTSAVASAATSDKIKAGIVARKEALAAGAPPPPKIAGRSKHDAPLAGDAADPDGRDELEAKQELRKGKSVRDVARDFGFRIDLVASWHAEVLAEREKGRAA